MTNQLRVRIAPSPTGDPHIGTAYTALFNFALAKKMHGKFILRIEDTDRTRLVPGSDIAIFKSLTWLGLKWDEGPDINGAYGPYVQSERLALYQQYGHELVKKRAAYYCFCSPEKLEEMRKAQREKHLPPMYDGTCRKIDITEAQKRIEKGEKFVIRLKTPKEGETKFTDLIRGEVSFKNELIDDQVLLKSDGWPTYHLGVVIDDYLMKISHVIRAEEWLSSTPKHILLYQAFGWSIPQFAHLPLLRNPDHSKISKRKNPVSLIWYHDQGYLPEALLNFLALMGFSLPNDQEIFNLKEFIDHFSLERIKTSAPVFNLEKLDWINGEYIRKKSLKDLAETFRKWMAEAGFEIPTLDNDYFLRVLELVQDRLKKMSDFEKLTDFFFSRPQVEHSLLLAGRDEGEIKAEIAGAIEGLKEIKEWKKETLENSLRQLCKDLDFQPPRLFMGLRIALTGKTATPPLFETMEVLGRDEVIERLEKVFKSA